MVWIIPLENLRQGKGGSRIRELRRVLELGLLGQDQGIGTVLLSAAAWPAASVLQVGIWEPVGNPALVSLGESPTGGLKGSLNGSLEGHPLYSQLYTPIEQTSFNVYVATLRALYSTLQMYGFTMHM